MYERKTKIGRRKKLRLKKPTWILQLDVKAFIAVGLGFHSISVLNPLVSSGPCES